MTIEIANPDVRFLSKRVVSRRRGNKKVFKALECARVIAIIIYVENSNGSKFA
jgi:hypothetical protein